MKRSVTSATSLAIAIAMLWAIGPTGWASAEDDSAERLVVHEWGTFTSLQEETGRTIGGINTDDEAVPDFVYRLADVVYPARDLAPAFSKGITRSHPDVEMRLETPVVYFYPPASQTGPMKLNVKVSFRGGWLTEYYPRGKAQAPGVAEGGYHFGSISADGVGTLEWNDLTVGGEGQPPATDSRIWLAPREVDAALVTNAEGESERYLFYRGVGKVDAPLRVVLDEPRGELAIQEQLHAEGLAVPLPLRAMWLADIRGDGAVAYRALGAAELTGESGRELARVPDKFADEDFSSRNLAALRHEMLAALLDDGLYADEAEALLETWKAGYFQSPGLRLFYLLPRQWTDSVMPLEISVPCDLTRSMVGRIEIVTSRQRDLLGRIGSFPASKSDWLWREMQRSGVDREELTKVHEGTIGVDDLGVAVPEDYAAYLGLGRFRDALVLDSFTREPAAGLQPFVENYGLRYHAAD